MSPSLFYFIFIFLPKVYGFFLHVYVCTMWVKENVRSPGSGVMVVSHQMNDRNQILVPWKINQYSC